MLRLQTLRNYYNYNEVFFLEMYVDLSFSCI